MFCLKGLTKETYLYGYGPLFLIRQQQFRWYNYNQKISKGVLHYNRRDIFEWLLTDQSHDGYDRLKWLCYDAMKESKLDILREIFQRADEWQLEYLRDCDNDIDFCATAAYSGKLECLKLLRQNECGWNRWTWHYAKHHGHEHILEYLRNSDYPTKWQN